jgi:hydrogenase maturation protease
MSGSGVVVIGVGNPYRSDDGVGPRVVARLRECVPPGVEVVEETGEPAALVLRWTGRRLAVLVDAISSGRPAGTVHRTGWAAGAWEARPATSAHSSHALGVAEAVELGRALGRLPDRLLLLGVEAGSLDAGEGLTAAVAGAVDGVVAAVLAEVADTAD